MLLTDELRDMERAEDLFARYQVAFDPHVVDVHRVQILKHFGEKAAALAAVMGSAQVNEFRRQLALALTEVHDQIARGDSPQHLRPGYDGTLVRIRKRARAGGP